LIDRLLLPKSTQNAKFEAKNSSNATPGVIKRLTGNGKLKKEEYEKEGNGTDEERKRDKGGTKHRGQRTASNERKTDNGKEKRSM